MYHFLLPDHERYYFSALSSIIPGEDWEKQDRFLEARCTSLIVYWKALETCIIPKGYIFVIPLFGEEGV